MTNEDIALIVRLIAAALFTAAFFGMGNGWSRRWSNLTAVGRRQYTAGLGMMVLLSLGILYAEQNGIPLNWFDFCRLVVASGCAYAFNYRLKQEPLRKPQHKG